MVVFWVFIFNSPLGYKTPFEVFAKITGKDYFLNGSVALMG
ncbi:hypothetical protein BPUTSESOX_1217 [uncultured Gammaproteobacteria bacterium]|nr:hypothetical protein [uncultured Gammaproteobacteria bacterium]SSC11202.1 hypothetical protein BPUTEOSOX_1540 [thiotrophic endosymbiont of Bathymodiolus puteoserpentis (Logatchev)]VVH51874.1 hypothetical protein BPUTSESOX_1217 [uncultured Gammaproteobacteria bacterium]